MRQRFWLGPSVVFAVALALYLTTAPPGLTWAHDSADGGDLIAAALVRGVPHPSGYPTAILLASAFAKLPWHTAAWRITLISMLSGAAAATLVSATVQRLTVQTEGPNGAGRIFGIAIDEGMEEPAIGWRSSFVSSFLFAAPGIIAGLALAFSPLLWGQATVAEVYALHACLAASMIWALVRWRYSGRTGWAVVAGAVFGLALGNHLTSIWLAPLAFVCLVLTPVQPAARGRALASFVLAMAAGLLVYVYLPVSAVANPPVNWGNPHTAAGFWWVVSGQLYRSFVFAASWTESFGRLAVWSGLLWREFLPWGVALALTGLARLWQADRSMALGMLASLVFGLVWAAGYDTSDSLLTLLPGWVMIGVWIGLGMAWLMTWLRRIGNRAALTAGLVGLALLAVPLSINWTSHDLTNDRQAEDFVAGVFDAVEPDALLVTAGDRATFSVWYARYGLARRPDIIPVSRDLWALESYRETVATTHPSLAGELLPSELDALLTTSLQSQRPVYFVQVGAVPADGADLQLLEGATVQARLAASVAPSEASVGWVLWRVYASP